MWRPRSIRTWNRNTNGLKRKVKIRTLEMPGWRKRFRFIYSRSQRLKANSRNLNKSSDPHSESQRSSGNNSKLSRKLLLCSRSMMTLEAHQAALVSCLTRLDPLNLGFIKHNNLNWRLQTWKEKGMSFSKGSWIWRRRTKISWHTRSHWKRKSQT